jgi:hypothetical protein
MSNTLHDVLPREQVGPVTDERYEFQFHQAAVDALRVLDESDVICVYCEWHDDYVIEVSGAIAYRFHQVKTRSAKRGPWKLTDFFGHTRRAKKKRHEPPSDEESAAGNGVNKTDDAESSVFANMLEHLRTFSDRCAAVVFVTDAGIDSDFEKFIESAHSASTIDALPADARATLVKLEKGLRRLDSKISADEVWSFLQRFSVQQSFARFGDLRHFRILMADRIRELSEIDLRLTEAEKIGSELVSLVRSKSHVVLKPAPADLAVLRAKKALVIDDVLKVLSLSPAGYRALKKVGKEAVVALSKLQRLCQNSELPGDLIPDLCRLKSVWDSWWVEQRHILNRLDVIALKKAAGDALRLHAEGKLNFQALRDEARTLAQKFSGVLTATQPLSDEVVFGLMLAIAVEAEQ